MSPGVVRVRFELRDRLVNDGPLVKWHGFAFLSLQKYTEIALHCYSKYVERSRGDLQHWGATVTIHLGLWNTKVLPLARGGKRVKRSAKKAVNKIGDSPLYVGYQWGEPLSGESSFLVNRVGEELEITAAMPNYLSSDHPCDLVRQYQLAPKNQSIGKQRTGKDSPHIRFANADSDDELINFVRSFGPVVSKSCVMLPFDPPHGNWSAGDPHPQVLMRARQDLHELRIEQQIYKAALGLVVELARKAPEYDIDSAKERMADIARGVPDWLRQWNREKKERGENPLWRVREDSIRRVAALAKSGPDLLLPPQVDARIVLCELVNVFPSLAFPNPAEMHSYIRFGIRPLLYSVLTREFLQPRDVGCCANSQCRDFFEIERAGQRYCNDQCSRKQRQREYWQSRGKIVRKERSADRSKGRNFQSLSA
jgi:hypothetical protein